MAPRFDNPLFNNVQFEPLAVRLCDAILIQPASDPADLDNTHLLGHRVEAIARKYLLGHEIFIQSACLRGPFGEEWTNPWGQSKRAILESRGKKRKLLLEDDFQRSRLRRAEEKESRECRARVLQKDCSAHNPVSPLSGIEKFVQSRIHLSFNGNFSRESRNDTQAIEVTQGTIHAHKRVSSPIVQSHVPEITSSSGKASTIAIEMLATLTHEDLNAKSQSPERMKRDERLKERNLVLASVKLPNSGKTNNTQDSLPTPSDSGNEDHCVFVIGEAPQGEESTCNSSRAKPIDTPVTEFPTTNRTIQQDTARAQPLSVAMRCGAMHGRSIGTSQSVVSWTSNHEESDNEHEMSVSRRPNVMPCHLSSCSKYETQHTLEWSQGSRTSETLRIGYDDHSKYKRNVKNQSRAHLDVITKLPHPNRTASAEKTIENEASSNFALPCNLAQRTIPIPHNDLHRTIYTPSKPFPSMNSQVTKLPHSKIVRAMFSSGPLKDAKNADKQLFALMGPRFVPHWDKAIRRRKFNVNQKAKEVKDSSSPHAETGKVTHPAKSKPPFMTFETPVATRSMRKNTRRMLEEFAPSVAAMNETVEQPQESLPIGQQVVYIDINLQDIEKTALGQDCGEQIKSSETNERARTDLDADDNELQNPNLMLLDLHTNTILPADKVSPLRKLARRSASRFETNSLCSQIHGKELQEECNMSGKPDPMGLESREETTSPYISTQIAMLQAQSAFQDALDYPIRGEVSTASVEVTTPSTNVDQGHSLAAARLIENTSEIAYADPDTQALFDAFVFDTTPGSHKGNNVKTESRKRASFAPTPLGPREANLGLNTRVVSVKGCLKPGARQTQATLSYPGEMCSRRSLSELGKTTENTTLDEMIDFESYIEQVGSFLGDWDIGSGVHNVGQ